MSKGNILLVGLVMFFAGWLANGHIQPANAQTTQKTYEYKVTRECASTDPKAVEGCLNSIAKQGWRVHVPWGSQFMVFER